MSRSKKECWRPQLVAAGQAEGLHSEAGRDGACFAALSLVKCAPLERPGSTRAAAPRPPALLLQDNAHGEKALLRVLQDICGDHGSKPMPGVKVRRKGGHNAVDRAWPQKP